MRKGPVYPHVSTLSVVRFPPSLTRKRHLEIFLRNPSFLVPLASMPRTLADLLAKPASVLRPERESGFAVCLLCLWVSTSCLLLHDNRREGFGRKADHMSCPGKGYEKYNIDHEKPSHLKSTHVCQEHGFDALPSSTEMTQANCRISDSFTKQFKLVKIHKVQLRLCHNKRSILIAIASNEPKRSLLMLSNQA